MGGLGANRFSDTSVVDGQQLLLVKGDLGKRTNQGRCNNRSAASSFGPASGSRQFATGDRPVSGMQSPPRWLVRSSSAIGAF